MKLSVVFTVLNQLKIDHWQTKSYAEHKALGTAYKNLDGLFDTFVEVFYGRNTIPSSNTTYSIKSDSYADNVIERYKQMSVKVVEYLLQLSENSGDLKNITDEIEGEFNHLLYRLQQK